jgi:hypothetical protein
MRTSWYRIKRKGTQAKTSQQVLSTETREREQKLQTELDLWRQQVKKDAQLEASRGKGSLSLGGIEALLRKISEEVTIEAQERQRGGKLPYVLCSRNSTTCQVG